MADVSLAVVNGRIRTGDARRPIADALAMDGAVLVLVGSSAEVRKLAGPDTRVIDLRGAALRPEPPDAVLRRGAPASFRVAGAEGDDDLLRVDDGRIVADAYP